MGTLSKGPRSELTTGATYSLRTGLPTLYDRIGRVGLVIGAASGIGRAVAFMAASHGAIVVASGLAPEGAQRTTAESALG